MVPRDFTYDISQVLQTPELESAYDVPTPNFLNSFSEGIGPSAIGSGGLEGQVTVQSGYLRSSNYDGTDGVGGTVGWWLGPTVVDLPSVTVESLDIPDTTTPNSFHVESDGDTYWGANVATGFAAAPASIGKDGAAKFTSVTITGASSTIAGRDIAGFDTVVDDGATPAAPTGLTATAGIQYNLIEWTANSETDMSYYEVWRHTSDVSGSATKIAEIKTTFMVDGGLTGGTAQYYWIKAVDHLGNTSGFNSGTTTATPRNVENADVTEIQGDKVLISGAVYLSNWRSGSDVTKIDGGEIYTNSITATQIAAGTITTAELNFTPVVGTNVIASINASAEGINIDADNIAISGTTTFSAGWAAASNAEADINALNTTNGPAEAGADVTSANQAATIASQGALATLNAVGTGQIDTTVISGGKIVTGLLTADNIQAGSLNAQYIGAGTISSKSIVLDVSPGTGDVEIRAGIATGDFANSGAASGFIIGVDDSDSDLAKFYFGDGTSYLEWDGADLNLAGSINDIGKFGGDGSDGPLTISAGTTTLSAASAQTVEKNYTTISITGTGTLDITTPHANGTFVRLRSQGAVTLTSSNTCIDATGMGATNGTGGGVGADGNPGTSGTSWAVFNNGGAGGDGVNSTTPGVASATTDAIEYLETAIDGQLRWSCGAGGAGGGGTNTPSGGAGARGGGAVYIECGGALNFTKADGIDVSGSTGSVGSNGSSNDGGCGGGGGGAGGTGVIVYNSLTANTGTIKTDGGAGGNGGNGATSTGAEAGAGGGAGGGNTNDGGAGGAGGAQSNAGSNGTAGSGTSGGAGGTGGTVNGAGYPGGGGGGGGGADGVSYVLENLYFS